MEETAKKRPWLVRIHYRLRTVSFALLFIATLLQFAGREFNPGAWALLGLMLLVYPHLQYWRACRATDSLKAEMDSLLMDSVLLGVYAATVQFSLWLSFSALLGTLTNNAANKGWRGMGLTFSAVAAGALLGGLVTNFAFVPETGWAATLFCMVGLSGYLLAVGNLGFTRNQQLRLTREELRGREKELLAANETLRQNIEAINVLQQQLHEQAIRDPLTGLYNRRYLDSTLERELARCKREGESLSVIMIDIDHFKKINDTYGHQAGDEMLCRLAHCLGSIARAEDVACRYGGEEFVLLMPTMPLSVAWERAEKLRTAFAGITVAFGSFRLQATLSIGISLYPGNGGSASELIRCADTALYEAKQAGRNQVRIAPGSNPAPVEAEKACLVQLIWHRSYESGDAEIDEQHRALFGQVNRILVAMLADRPEDDLLKQIDRLVTAIVEHFKVEEALFAEIDYPDAASHAAGHAELVAQATDLLARCRAGDFEFGALFQFLAHDVIARHILGADRGYFPFIEAARRAGGRTWPAAGAPVAPAELS